MDNTANSQDRRTSTREKKKPDRFGDWFDGNPQARGLPSIQGAGNGQSVNGTKKRKALVPLRRPPTTETEADLEIQLSGLTQEIQETETTVHSVAEEIKADTVTVQTQASLVFRAETEEENTEQQRILDEKKAAFNVLTKNLAQKQMILKHLKRCRQEVQKKLDQLRESSSDESESNSEKDEYEEGEENHTVIDNRRRDDVQNWVHGATNSVLFQDPLPRDIATDVTKDNRDQEFEEAQLAEIERIEKEAEKRKNLITNEIEQRRKQRLQNQPPNFTPQPSLTGTTEQQIIQLLQTQLSILQSQASNTAAPHVTSNKFLARQSRGNDLPSFSGRPEEWPAFKTAFTETTTICEFSDAENIGRLRKSLKGDAARIVECLMVSSTNLPAIIRLLESRFGQPQHIVRALIIKAKSVPNVKEDKLESLIEFGIAVQNMTSTMKALNCDAHMMNPQLLEELEHKLSVRQRMDWLKWIKANAGKNQGIQDFSEWLQQETEFASRLCPPEMKASEADGRKFPKKDKVFSTTKNPQPKPRTGKCTFCENEGHWMYECRKFAQLTESDKWKQVGLKRLCFLCLRPGHRTEVCRSKRLCGKDGCSGKHHQLLHKSQGTANTTLQDNPNNPSQLVANQTQTVGHTSKSNTSDVLLKIVPVILSGPKGDFKTYAFFDEGSTISMMDASVAANLGLTGRKEPLCIQWTNGVTRTESDSQLLTLRIRGDYDGSRSYSMYGVRTIRNISLPIQTVDVEALSQRWEYLKNGGTKSMWDARPTLLIGEDYLPLIVSRKVFHGPWNSPYLSHTWLGWVIHGRESSINKNQGTDYSMSICHRDSPDDLLHQLVKDSFRTENFGVKIQEDVPRSREDKRALVIMQKTTAKVGDRYETGLLWKDPSCELPPSRHTALHRLRCLEKKIDRDPQLFLWYNQKIQDYILKGYVRKLSLEESKLKGPRTWYLPHFFHFHPNKPGKPRLVFDAAAKSQGLSLNDHLMKGPDLVNPLPSVLFKFRQRRLGITADIQEMFHQVRMRREDRSSQRFLWRGQDRTEDPDEYEIQVMFFGSSSSPSSAQFVKNTNATEHAAEFPDACRAIIHNHYVDDYIDSVDTPNEASKLFNDVTEVHRRGGFHIRGWISNNREILDQIPANLRADGLKVMDQVSEIPSGRVLGLVWNPEVDSFTWNFNFNRIPGNIVDGSKVPTKREVLRLVMSLFDPLGFIAHFVIKAKILLQSIWRSEIGWDDEIPSCLFEQWQLWVTELQNLKYMKIPRCYSVHFSNAKSHKELHVFCDASKDAFSAIAYLRNIYEEDIEIAFIAAKSKVAPLKPLSIPRMELQAAVLGSRLAHTINKEHDIKFDRTIFWSDSCTVLSWIRADAKTFKTFVAHRVGEIEELTDAASWKWVPTKDNVADDATRNNYPCDMSSESRWLSGPEFLRSTESEWPREKVYSRLDIDEDDELIRVHSSFTTTTTKYLVRTWNPEALPSVGRFSSLWKLIRCTTWIARFICNIKNPFRREQCSLELSVEELKESERIWWNRSQQDCFHEELNCIKKGEPLGRKSILRNLSPFIDEWGTLRVNGRLNNSEAVECVRWPVILHPNHPFTILLIRYYHEAANHHGRERVLNNIRMKFWIPNIRVAVKRSWSNCTWCKNRRSQPVIPEMGQLPHARVTPYNPPFTSTGMDYFGPMEVTIGRRHEKRYGVLFTCLATRAVHLEIAASLTTDSAIMAIRRMSARRGQPKEIYSDNGTNLRGADTELRKSLQVLSQVELQRQLATMGDGIRWHFIPPSAPHMGGAWERCVRSVKTALHAVLKERAPKEETLQTLFAEAEAAVNSQPLTHVSIDPDDPVALTPNSFLILRGDNLTSPGVFNDKDLMLRQQWRVAQRLADLFWKRWISEYLPTLTRRTKWHNQSKPVSVDDIVIIIDNQGPRATWPLGIIQAVFPGKDGKIRVVEVKTNTGTYRRPVSKICVLDVRKKDPSNPLELISTKHASL